MAVQQRAPPSTTAGRGSLTLASSASTPAVETTLAFSSSSSNARGSPSTGPLMTRSLVLFVTRLRLRKVAGPEAWLRGISWRSGGGNRYSTSGPPRCELYSGGAGVRRRAGRQAKAETNSPPRDKRRANHLCPGSSGPVPPLRSFALAYACSRLLLYCFLTLAKSNLGTSERPWE